MPTVPRHPWRYASLALFAAACSHATPRLDARSSEQTPLGAFELQYDPADKESAGMVRRAVTEAAPRLARWGTLRRPVLVQIFPSHDDLEQAVDRVGYSWLRAWARYRIVFVQSPRSWSSSGATQAQMNELLLHELTHCVMYQEAADEGDWQYKGIPIWFREGMASVTADQAYRRGTLAELSRYLKARENRDPINDAENLYQRRSDIVYTTAHHAFAFLDERYGEKGIRLVLEEMFQGRKFDAAFEAALGLSRKDFEDEFRRFVRMEGFRAQHR